MQVLKLFAYLAFALAIVSFLAACLTKKPKLSARPRKDSEYIMLDE